MNKQPNRNAVVDIDVLVSRPMLSCPTLDLKRRRWSRKMESDCLGFQSSRSSRSSRSNDIRSHVVIQTKELDLRNLRVRATTMRVHQHKITSLGYFWLLPLPPHAFCSSLEGSRQEYERRILNEERESYVTHG